MIDPFDLYNDFIAIANTYQGGFWRPETDFARNVNNVSLDMWNEYINQAEKTQKVNDFLRPFMRTQNCAVQAQNQFYGLVNYPADFGRYSAARILVVDGKCYEFDCDEVKRAGWRPDTVVFASYVEEERIEEDHDLNDFYDRVAEYPVDKIDDSRWGACLAHLTKGPTMSRPKMVQTNFGFKVAPRQVSVVVLDYYKRPTPCTFVYTIQDGDIQTGAGDQLIYNQAQSTPLEWDVTLKDEFVKRLLPRYGIFTSNSALFQEAKVNE